MSSSSFMELLTENAELKKKIALLDPSLDSDDSNPLKKELAKAEAKIDDLTKALEDRISEVDLIEEKSKLQEFNAILTEKLQNQAEELAKSQSQLQDAKDQADLLEFRVLELEEEIEKARKKKHFHARKNFIFFNLQNKANLLNDGAESTLDGSIYSDSGCNSSIATDVDSILELQDFRVS